MPKAERVPIPTRLPPFVVRDGERALPVVIETARGDRNKISFDEELGVFRLKRILPEGMRFPHDFGFVPSTRGGDGDPLDALVLMDARGAPGCLVECRLIGVILGAEGPKAKARRNDRLVAVATASHTHGELKHVKELNRHLLDELERFFVNYHAEHGERFRVLGCKGPRAAWRLVEDGASAWRGGDARAPG